MFTCIPQARLRELAARDADAYMGGSVHFHVLPNAGHWVHVDNPEGVKQLLGRSLEDMGGHLAH